MFALSQYYIRFVGSVINSLALSTANLYCKYTLTLLDHRELVAHRRLVCMVVTCLGSHSAADLDKAKYVENHLTHALVLQLHVVVGHQL